jgi:ABC-type multidrug transport system fused ATPase/permease subunit
VDNVPPVRYSRKSRGRRGARLKSEPVSMLTRFWRGLFADPSGSPALLRRLLIEHGSSHWRRYLFSFALMAVSAGCTAAMAFIVGPGIDEAYTQRRFAGVAIVGVTMIALFTMKGLSTYGQTVTLARIGNQIIADNQRRMFDKLLGQDAGFYADRHSSEFAARITFGAGSAAQVLSLVINALGRDLLSLIGLVGVMVWKAPFMAILAFMVMPPAVLTVRKLMKRVRAITLTQFDGGADILKTMQETIQGFRIIKAFNLETVVRAQVYDSIASVERASNKLARVANRSTPLMEALGGFAIAGVFIYGGYRVLVLNLPPGELFSFVTAFLLAYEPAKRIARLNIELHNSLTGVQVLFDVLDVADRKPARPKLDIKVTRGGIEFDQVSFAYRAGSPVLRQLSFVAKPGEVTAFVGPSGGGKSTIFNLVLALYAPASGAIRLDGQDYAAVSEESIRRRIAFVGQDVFLFHGTIRHNIGLGRPGASEAEIIAAARAAYADEFISQFAAGYDTMVGEQGAQLSGGQRQRIAIARALIRDAPIILLDEPTAALDAESERFVQRAMGELIKGRTTLVIAHRLHTVVQADMIYVLEKGMILESGRHAELLARSGRYAYFYRMHFSRDAAQSVNEVSIVPG